MIEQGSYWKKLFGIEFFKIRYYALWLLYNAFGIKLPKLKDQRDYWADRGQVYMDEIINSGYLQREIFFQNMLIDELKRLEFDSFFEAGCGFGWNIRRVHEEFRDVRVGGLDFSFSQLFNSKRYLEDMPIPAVNGDNCFMPLSDGAFDVGFSLGVFMNIHPERIKFALQEMVRVCRKYIIHIEYDERNTTAELREKRAFKRNIVSHDYERIYKDLGMQIASFQTYKEFGDLYYAYEDNVIGRVDRWEGFEGPEKYVFILVKSV